MPITETYTSNTLYNDSTGVIAFAEQLKQKLINWANYHHVTEELGPDNRPDTQNALNNLFLSVYERFLTFLNDADATKKAINTWKEIERFLADYTDEKTLAEIVAELNANIESRLTVPLESTTGSSTTSTMTQKAITETIDASKTFTTGEKVDNVGIDAEPTAGSDNLVKSGGVKNELALGTVYDVSAKNPTAGPNNDGKWESLSALLSDANLSTLIPVSVRKGGMSIKFIQSSDNKYVQFRYMPSDAATAATFTNVANWQGVDNEVIKGSENLVTSGGVAKLIREGKGDFSISDENANVIVQFYDGHVKTKNFDSKNIPQDVITADNEDVDLDFQDEDGNVLARFRNGGFETKNFNSEKIVPIIPFIDKYKGKKISILGDSISTFGDEDSRNELGTYCYSYFPTQTCRYSKNGTVTIDGQTYDSIQFDVQNTWWMNVINMIGARLGINESWRGTKVSGTGVSAFNNQTRINHLGENGTPNLILVFGGTNDAGNAVTLGTFDGGNYSDYNTAEKIAALPVTTFADAYKAMLIRLMYTYPLAEIVCILPTFTTAYYTISSLDNYVEVIKEVCDFFGIKWIDVRVSDINIFNKATYLVDGIHPNVQGMTLLANKIYKHLIFD